MAGCDFPHDIIELEPENSRRVWWSCVEAMARKNVGWKGHERQQSSTIGDWRDGALYTSFLCRERSGARVRRVFSHRKKRTGNVFFCRVFDLYQKAEGL